MERTTKEEELHKPASRVCHIKSKSIYTEGSQADSGHTEFIQSLVGGREAQCHFFYFVGSGSQWEVSFKQRKGERESIQGMKCHPQNHS